MMFNPALLTTKMLEICEVGRFLFEKGWCSATSGNFSCRLNNELIAITVSGHPKGELTQEDVIVVNMMSNPLESTKKPSNETPLHLLLYQMDDNIEAVLHTHSVNATVLSRLYAPQQKLKLENYEMLKAFHGTTTHETQEIVPIFPNTQDIPSLAKQVKTYLAQYPATHGYLVASHGLYTWGTSLAEDRRHVEAFEFLFECEILALRLGTAISPTAT